MFHTLTMRGAEGFIEWGYQCAAHVTAWTVTRGDSGLTLTGTVTQLNSFRLSQVPLTFRVPRQNGPWIRTIRDLQIADGGALTATLVPQESQHGP